MHKFDYSFLDYGTLPAQLFNIATDIYSLRVLSQTRKEQFIEIFTELAVIAKIQSVKNSNAIEGILTTDERINAIVKQNSAPLNHNEQEIAGYRDALAQIHTDYKNISFNEADILRLHAIMLNIAGYSYGGKYKDSDNAIIEIDEYGQRRIRFSPTPADATAKAMEQMILAYQDASNNPNINQLHISAVIIASAIQK